MRFPAGGWLSCLDDVVGACSSRVWSLPISRYVLAKVDCWFAGSAPPRFACPKSRTFFNILRNDVELFGIHHLDCRPTRLLVPRAAQPFLLIVNALQPRGTSLAEFGARLPRTWSSQGLTVCRGWRFGVWGHLWPALCPAISIVIFNFCCRRSALPTSVK
jgi:hypothetical protein